MSDLLITRALLVGCGGTGSYLADPLARLLSYSTRSEAHIFLCDGDEFEMHNLTRQSTELFNVGINKALATQTYLADRAVDAHIQVIPDYLNEASIRSWIEQEATPEADSPLIIATVDNDMTRKIILDAIEETRENFKNFLFISPGNASGVSTVEGQVFYWGRDSDGPIGMNPTLVYPALQDPQEPAPARGSCTANAPSEPQLISANMLAAAWTLSIVQGYLDGTLAPKTHACFFTGSSAETV